MGGVTVRDVEVSRVVTPVLCPVWWSGLVVLVLLKNGKNDRAMNESIWNGELRCYENEKGLKATAIRLGSSGYRPSISAIRHCEDRCQEEGCGGTISEHKDCGFDDRNAFIFQEDQTTTWTTGIGHNYMKVKGAC